MKYTVSDGRGNTAEVYRTVIIKATTTTTMTTTTTTVTTTTSTTTTTTTTATTTTTTTTTHNCRSQGFAERDVVMDWAQDKRSWCCTQELQDMASCSGVTSTTMTTTTTQTTTTQTTSTVTTLPGAQGDANDKGTGSKGKGKNKGKGMDKGKDKAPGTVGEDANAGGGAGAGTGAGGADAGPAADSSNECREPLPDNPDCRHPQVAGEKITSGPLVNRIATKTVPECRLNTAARTEQACTALGSRWVRRAGGAANPGDKTRGAAAGAASEDADGGDGGGDGGSMTGVVIGVVLVVLLLVVMMVVVVRRRKQAKGADLDATPLYSASAGDNNTDDTSTGTTGSASANDAVHETAFAGAGVGAGEAEGVASMGRHTTIMDADDVANSGGYSELPVGGFAGGDGGAGDTYGGTPAALGDGYNTPSGPAAPYIGGNPSGYMDTAPNPLGGGGGGGGAEGYNTLSGPAATYMGAPPATGGHGGDGRGADYGSLHGTAATYESSGFSGGAGAGGSGSIIPSYFHGNLNRKEVSADVRQFSEFASLCPTQLIHVAKTRAHAGPLPRRKACAAHLRFN